MGQTQWINNSFEKSLDEKEEKLDLQFFVNIKCREKNEEIFLSKWQKKLGNIISVQQSQLDLEKTRRELTHTQEINSIRVFVAPVWLAAKRLNSTMKTNNCRFFCGEQTIERYKEKKKIVFASL